jgi:hypothetical protein
VTHPFAGKQTVPGLSIASYRSSFKKEMDASLTEPIYPFVLIDITWHRRRNIQEIVGA